MIPVAALIITIIAYLVSGVGGIIAAKGKSGNVKHLSVFVGFAAGGMLAIALADLLPETVEALSELDVGNKILSALMFCVGAALVFAAHYIVHLFAAKKGEPHIHTEACCHDFIVEPPKEENGSLKIPLVAIITLISFSFHGAFEGAALYTVCLTGIKAGLPLAVAIGIHNLPAGIAVGNSILTSGYKKRHAICAAFLSGLTGVIFAVIIFAARPVTAITDNTKLLSIIYPLCAGTLLSTAVAELLPDAIKQGGAKRATSACLVGAVITALISMIFSV
ncbi:MAG: ZIP family metal transporter [Christensenellaceae bacterium]|jgi:ZIP family zinc transporter|nr:ZIP family metal transporter [Christensenellaceae bacterium]